MSHSMFLLLAGMSIVTYLPRMLPLVFMRADRIPPRLQAVLRNVPYAALGALIVPGIFTFHEDPMFGVVGAATAGLAAYLRGNLITVVGCSIAALSIYSYFY